MSYSLCPRGLQHARLLTISQSLLKFMSIESVILSDHLILCRPLLILPSIFPSIRVFSSELALHIRWPNYWSFSFSISFSNEYSGLISFRIDWFDLAVQGTLNSLLQHHSPKASVLQHSAFFMVQLCGLQHARLSCPSPSPGASHIHWVGDALQPSHPMPSPSFCLHFFPVSGSFLRSQFFDSCGQSIGASASASVFPMNIWGWFPLGLTGLILLPKGLSSLLQHHSSKA